MTSNDLTNRLLNAAIVASVMLAIALYAYYEWQPSDPGPPETEMQIPGPVGPVPRTEDHVNAVMDRNCPECPDCPTYDALKRAGVEVICTNAFGEVPSVNYWPQDMPMACTKIKEVRITNDRIKVIGGKR